jgi:hypothetical protein
MAPEGMADVLRAPMFKFTISFRYWLGLIPVGTKYTANKGMKVDLYGRVILSLTRKFLQRVWFFKRETFNSICLHAQSWWQIYVVVIYEAPGFCNINFDM